MSDKDLIILIPHTSMPKDDDDELTPEVQAIIRGLVPLGWGPSCFGLSNKWHDGADEEVDYMELIFIRYPTVFAANDQAERFIKDKGWD